MDLKAALRAGIRTVPDFPKAGVLFKDITPVLQDPPRVTRCVGEITSAFADGGFDRHIASRAGYAYFQDIISSKPEDSHFLWLADLQEVASEADVSFLNFCESILHCTVFLHIIE